MTHFGAPDPSEAARRAAWEQQARKVGAQFALYGYGLMVFGLAISFAGRYPGLGLLRWLGLGFFFPALACFLLVFFSRRRWRRDHPFNG